MREDAIPATLLPLCTQAGLKINNTKSFRNSSITEIGEIVSKIASTYKNMFSYDLLASLCEECRKDYNLFSSWNLLEDYKGAVKEETHIEYELYMKICKILPEKDKMPRVTKYFFTRYIASRPSAIESVVLWEYLADNIRPIYGELIQSVMTNVGYADFMVLKNCREGTMYKRRQTKS